MQNITHMIDRLNPDQRRAVDTIEGPVMVVAGPGTGKTEVVSLRVASILQRTQMEPRHILCLTYSTSGATAMRERLRRVIGSAAYGVTVNTIHGFCNANVLQEYSAIFDPFGEHKPASDIQRVQLMNELIDELPLSCAIVSPKDRYGRTQDILGRISEMKREGITLDTLSHAASEYRIEMESKSKPHTKAHTRNLHLAAQCEEFVRLFSRYTDAMKERNLYDYEDMLLKVIDALTTEQWLLMKLQERFQYILVDEFQDTNGAQNRVISLLSTPVIDLQQDPNIFVVGDDDQAIYRFQGASVATMLDFLKRFPQCPVITLKTSYRSTQAILDAATSMISVNTTRLSATEKRVTKTLQSARTDGDNVAPILLRPASDAVEGWAIAENVQDFLAGSPPIDAKDIAIFTRTNHELLALYDILRSQNIPVQITGKLDLLKQPRVRELLTLLQAIEKVQDNEKLATALACPVFDCHPADIALLFAQLRASGHQRRAEGKSALSLADMLATLTDEDGRKESPAFRTVQQIIAARDLLFHLSQRHPYLTLPDVLEHLIRESHMIPSNYQEIALIEYIAIQEFYAFVTRRCHENHALTLRTLLEEIGYYERYGIRLSFSVPHLMENAVQLMTAHASKGLEFDVVFIANFREKHWDHKRGAGSLSLPDHLIFAEQEAEDLSLEDERRLAFVACTRARKHLIFSCPEQITRADRSQDVSPSQFFSEAGNLQEHSYDLRKSTNILKPLQSKLDIEHDEVLRTFLRKKLETFELSVTALNNYLEDPEKFLWQDLLSRPRAKEPIFAYGSAVHAALLHWGQQARRHIVLSLPDFLDVFKRALQDNELLTKKEYSAYEHIGLRALPAYYEERLASGGVIIAGLEKRLAGRLGDVRLKGIVDRFDLYHETGKNVHIIDYKTGTPKTEKQVKEQYGGATYRQLVFYKLLSTLSPDFGGYEATEFSLDFVGEGEHEARRLTFNITAKECDELATLIRTVWQKITALDFTSPILYSKN